MVSAPHAAAAIEATLDAVERARDAAKSSVELKLTFGDDTRLAVRIELREDSVQTTFRTDSTELRQALSSEWHQAAPAVIATAPDRTLRMAEPVFTSATGSPDFAGTSTGGDAHPRQTQTAIPAESPVHSLSRAGSRSPAPAAAPARPIRLPTTLRLNAFA